MDTNFAYSTDWLEVGLIELGPVYIDIGSSMDHCRVDLAALQNSFLKLHDNRSRRLWFLWDLLCDLETDMAGPSNQQYCTAKCGCIGGCAFFGSNFNGRGFFDCDDSGSYPALANPNRRTPDPAFGQSILRENSFLVDLLDVASPVPSGGSEISNTSTVKQIDEVFNESDHSEVIGDGQPTEDVAPLLRGVAGGSVKITTNRHSLQNLPQSAMVDDDGNCLKRSHMTGQYLSTPVLLVTRSDSRKKKKNRRSHISLPVLPDVVDSSMRSMSFNRSESHSELYFSAEDDDDAEDESSSDELLSLSTHLISRSNPIPPGGEVNQKRVASLKSESATTNHSSSILSSRTASNMSFNSAISSAADFSLVDLHLQTARPVVDSPILLASYITHLSEVECPNWSMPAPKSPSESKSKYFPKFVTTKKGFTAFRLVDRPTYTPNIGTGPGSRGFAFSPQKGEDKCTNFWEGIQEEKNGLRNDATTIFVKIDRSINVMFSPLTLESAQRFAEALVPTLEQMHPLSVMARVYRRCISHVETHNPLKKERTTLLENKEPKEAAYQDVTHYHIRGSLQIPRINLCLLQAGIVEQIISLSALDNPRDLVCVSTAAICVDGLALHFSKSVQESRIVQAVSRPPTETHLTKKSKSKTRQGNSIATEVVFVESSVIDNEQLMVSGTLGKIHLQLRRLNNDVSLQLPENVTATVIPSNCSRVLFNYSFGVSNTFSNRNSSATPNLYDMQGQDDQDRYGIVMFECGLQGLNLRAVKRVSNGEDKLSKLTVEVELAPSQNIETSTERPSASADFLQQQPVVGSAPSHSSHLSFKLKSEKGTPTMEQEKMDHQQLFQQQQQSSQQHTPQQPPPQPQQQLQQQRCDDQDVSSCSLQIRTVWFSFAAPPRTTPAKKSDLAILDRNLLSTASPAINAWYVFQFSSSDFLQNILFYLIFCSG